MRRKNILKQLCLSLVFLLMFSTNVFAENPDGYTCDQGYHTFGDYTLAGGVGNYGYTTRYYWVSNLDDTYRNFLSNAVSEWVNTDIYTPISIHETSEQSESSFDVYNGWLGVGILGYTQFWWYDSEINITDQGALPCNYGWTQVTINVSSLNNSNYGISDEQKQATIAHELGHAMGLSHQNNMASSVMCQTAYGRYATRGSETDLYAINHLYQ